MDSPPSSGSELLPTKPKEKALSNFGTAIPELVLGKRPNLSGRIQQQVWFDDIREVHKHLRGLKKWLVQVADDLSPDDGMKDLLSSAIRRIPDFSDCVNTAQLCFDDVKSRYEKSCADQAQKRAELSRLRRYSPSLGVDDDEVVG